MMFPHVLAPTQVRIIGAELNLALGLFGSTVGPGWPHHASDGRPRLTQLIELDFVSCRMPGQDGEVRARRPLLLPLVELVGGMVGHCCAGNSTNGTGRGMRGSRGYGPPGPRPPPSPDRVRPR